MASVFESELDSAVKADPFVPFTVVLVGGSRYDVTGPYMLLVRDSVLDHFPYGSDQRNLLRTNQLAAIELRGSADRPRAPRKR